MKPQKTHFSFLVVVIAVFMGLAILGFTRLKIDTDVTKSLPRHDRIVSDALKIFSNHPIHDQVAVDIMIDRDDPDVLVNCSAFLRKKMQASGLFAEIGMGEVAQLLPEVARQAAHNLPYLFSKEELENEVAPRLQSDAVSRRLKDIITGMSSLEGMGRSATLALDPLRLEDLVLARLIHLAPSHNARIYKENLISKNGRHLLLTARPITAGSNTAAAIRITNLFNESSHELNIKYAATGIHVVLTPTGTYQAALDNEKIIRHDVKLALGLSTAGIALLLFLTFPRPLFSLLSLVPPLAGTAAALFVYSLFHSSISIMVLGFSGALISVMDDYSITYLLFLDRPKATQGKLAALEVQSIGGWIALLTTIASFVVLGFCDFPVFASLGEFTALGLAFTYLFIYFICPKIFPVMPPSRKQDPPLHKFSSILFRAGKPGLAAALLLVCTLAFFAKPHFHLSLSDMNTVSQKTQDESRMFTSVWGDIGRKVYVMTTAASRGELQKRNDRLLASMEQDMRSGHIQSVFNPSMIFPGPLLSAQNLAAWKAFWTVERVNRLKRDLIQTGTALGFKADAFAPFYNLLNLETPVQQIRLSASFDNLLGITTKPGGKLVQFTTVTPGTSYDSSYFFSEYGAGNKIFDAKAFSNRLSTLLFSTFSSSLIAMTVLVTLMLFLYYLDWRLTVITLLPLVFAYICTLGTLNLIGHPLDIPGLMLTVVILGIGVDYSIYTVCGRRRYGTNTHTSYVLVRSAVFLSAASTLIGFGVLCFAEHSTLRSVGITSLAGIGYSFLGCILLLPPLLDAYFQSEKNRTNPSEVPDKRILWRYRLLEAYPRVFARFKLKYDPLFKELPRMLGELTDIKKILDIGCGYGVPACWCLENIPASQVTGIDPDPQRVRVASMAVQERGTMIEGAAPQIPDIADRVDLVLLLDMLHYLDDQQLHQTFERIAKLLRPGGLLATRFVVRLQNERSFYWYIEDFRTRLTSVTPRYRTTEEVSAMMAANGFEMLKVRATDNKELFWITGKTCANA